MQEIEITSVPVVVMENTVNRMQKTLKWVVIAWVMSMLLLCTTFGFIWYTSGGEEIDYTTETNSSGNASINTGGGNINN